MSAKSQAEAMLEIAYAAFQTHYKVTAKPGWATAEEHWNRNPQAQTLWIGLVKGVLTNTANAQASGLLPELLAIDVTQPMLPGLGGAPLGPRGNTEPAALARRLAGQIRERQGPSGPAHDTVPGLAIGRATDDEPCDGEHSVVMDAIEAHIRGSDEE